MIDMKKKAEDILEDYADAYSQADLERLAKFLGQIQSEAARELVKRFEKKIKDVKFTLGLTWEIQNALKDTLKEMVGDGDA